MLGQKSKKGFLTLTTMALVGLSLGLGATKTKAAGVNFAIPLAANQSVNTSATITPVFTFTSTTTYTVGDTVTVYYGATNAYNDLTPSPLISSNVAMTGSGTFTTTNTVDTSLDFFRFTIATGTMTAGVVTITVSGTNLKAPAVAGNYDFVLSTSKGEYGAVLQYVGDANDVTVTAEVLPVLTFAIRNSADTADTNVCALGTLSVAAVNTCAYRLKVTTNATSGYTVTVDTDGDLRLSGTGNVADGLDINPITEDTLVTLGTEGYGIALVAGSVTSAATVTESGNFNDDDTPLPISTPTAFYTSAGVNAPAGTDTTNTALVTHRAAIGGGTSGGTYTQLVTYTVAATF